LEYVYADLWEYVLIIGLVLVEIPDVRRYCFQVKLISVAKETKVKMRGFVEDNGNAALKRSSLLGKYEDNLV